MCQRWSSSGCTSDQVKGKGKGMDEFLELKNPEYGLQAQQDPGVQILLSGICFHLYLSSVSCVSFVVSLSLWWQMASRNGHLASTVE